MPWTPWTLERFADIRRVSSDNRTIFQLSLTPKRLGITIRCDGWCNKNIPQNNHITLFCGSVLCWKCVPVRYHIEDLREGELDFGSLEGIIP